MAIYKHPGAPNLCYEVLNLDVLVQAQVYRTFIHQHCAALSQTPQHCAALSQTPTALSNDGAEGTSSSGSDLEDHTPPVGLKDGGESDDLEVVEEAGVENLDAGGAKRDSEA